MFYIWNQSNAISLSKKQDLLVWTWNKESGEVKVKEAYDALINRNLEYDSKWWYSLIWKVRAPLKLILFLWLILKNKVLTGENFRIRGGIGPSVCPLCLQAEETIQHLVVDCDISREIWKEVCS